MLDAVLVGGASCRCRLYLPLVIRVADGFVFLVRAASCAGISPTHLYPNLTRLSQRLVLLCRFRFLNSNTRTIGMALTRQKLGIS